MIKRLFILLAFAQPLHAQVANTAMMDSSDFKVKGKVTVEGYLDAYYAYNFNEPENGDQPYLVSMGRHNEVNINLAFIDVKYSSSRVRARIVPGFGTYMNSNYARETGSLKNLVEANAGIRLFKRKGIWVDVGVLGSPYTNESAISKDHLAYTRSLSAENVPYYLSGAKLTFPVSKKINAYFYLMNGWQQISDENSNKAFGTQVEFRPNNNLLLNWNTYIGKERAVKDSSSGIRYFNDFYLIYNKGRFSATSCIYYGVQKSNSKKYNWWQANVISKFAFTSALSGTVRLEYFNDMGGVVIVPITAKENLRTFGASVGLNYQLDENILIRTEARQLQSDQTIYIKNGNEFRNSLTISTSICAWF